jgi:hypothetical protein
VSKPKKTPKKMKAPPLPQGERFKRFAEAHGATDDVLDKALREVGKAKPKKG